MAPVGKSSKRPRLSVAAKMASSTPGSPVISLPSLAHLPDDVLIEICRNLPMAARMRIRRVNSRFHRIVPQSMKLVDLVGEFGLLAYSSDGKLPFTKATVQKTTYQFVVRQAAPSLIRIAGSNLTAANFYYSNGDQYPNFHHEWPSPMNPSFFEVLMSLCPNLKRLELNIDLTNDGHASKLSHAFPKLTCLKVDHFEASLICHFPCLRRLSVEKFVLPPKDHCLSPGIIESYQGLSGIKIRSNIELGDHATFYLSIASRVTACGLSIAYLDGASGGDSCVAFLGNTKALRRLTLAVRPYSLPLIWARLRDVFDSELTCLNDLTLSTSGFDDVTLLSSSLENLKSFNASGSYEFNFIAGCEKLAICRLECVTKVSLNQLNPNAPLTHFVVREIFGTALEEERILQFFVTRRYPLKVCHFGVKSSGSFFRCDDVSVFMTHHKSTLRELTLHSMIDLEPGFFKHKCFFPNLQLTDSPTSVLKKFVVLKKLRVKETVSIHDLQIAINDFVDSRARWMTEQTARFGKFSWVELSMILCFPGWNASSEYYKMVSNLFRKFSDRDLNRAGIVLIRNKKLLTKFSEL